MLLRTPISAEHLAIVILLDELELQCSLAESAIERLRLAAHAWKNKVPGAGRPIDVVGDCIICLSAAAAIYRLLEPGDRNGKRLKASKPRCRALRRVLGYPAVVELKKQGTRNSWEHMDERLDTVFTAGTFRSFAPVHVSPQPPSSDTFVHHHFDPVAMAIRHGADSLDLEALFLECADLREAQRFVQLHMATGEYAPYPGAPAE